MQTYLVRDIRDLVHIKDEGRFLKFLSCTAARTSQEVKHADIAKNVEIDLIILENGKLYPIEIRKSADPGKGALKNFSMLSNLPETIGEGAVVCMTLMVMPLDKKINWFPYAVSDEHFSFFVIF